MGWGIEDKLNRKPQLFLIPRNSTGELQKKHLKKSISRVSIFLRLLSFSDCNIFVLFQDLGGNKRSSNFAVFRGGGELLNPEYIIP